MLRALALSLALGVLAPFPLAAQEGQPVLGVVSLDVDRLFSLSAYGKALALSIEGKRMALIAENQRLVSELEAEERALTNQRATMDEAQFAPLAAAFDAKAQKIRADQGEKERALDDFARQERDRFLTLATPILRQVMQEHGASAIIDKRFVILDGAGIDITEAAIARLDQDLPPPAAP